jgi:chaperonin GroEL
VDRVVVTHNTCSIIQENILDAVNERIDNLKVELETTNQKDFFNRRIQLLNGVAATVIVGGITETERKEVYDRVEDAVFAVKAAAEEGWVAGGGSTFLYISNKMKAKFDNKDTQFGYDIVKKSIKAPFYQICDNANRKGSKYESKCKTYGTGYNAVTDEVGNLITEGVIDSKKSLRVSLENALYVSKLLLNIKVVISLQ